MPNPSPHAAQEKLKPGKWWALLNSPDDLPVLFATRKAARDSRLDDEYLVRVTVTLSKVPR